MRKVRKFLTCSCGSHAFVGATKGFTVLIDPEDVERVAKHNWCASDARPAKGYATCLAPGKIKVKMHRLLSGASIGDVVDHKNGNTFDNRKENLRICSAADNAQNRRRHRGRPGRFKGVYWMERLGAWQAAIGVAGKQHYLGLHKNADDAARVYDEAARKYFGNFARTNFPNGCPSKPPPVAATA